MCRDCCVVSDTDIIACRAKAQNTIHLEPYRNDLVLLSLRKSTDITGQRLIE